MMNPLQVNTDIMENGGDNIECKVEIQRLILFHINSFLLGEAYRASCTQQTRSSVSVCDAGAGDSR